MTETQLLILILSILAAGILLFILTGFIGVKKGWVAVVEKKGLYAGTYTKRWVYFFRFAYEAVGRYPLFPIAQTLEINGKKFDIIYSILDVKTFHYSGHDIPSAARIAFKDKTAPTVGQVKDMIRTIGCECIEVKGD